MGVRWLKPGGTGKFNQDDFGIIAVIYMKKINIGGGETLECRVDRVKE